MSLIRLWLKEGDLSNDGRANEVLQVVLSDLALVEDLVHYLEDEDDVVRGHAADVLEKLGRTHPAELAGHLPTLIRVASEDSVAMVRWHLAMLFGHVSLHREWSGKLAEVLIKQLSDASVFTQSWAVTSLCLVARQYPELGGEIVAAVAPMAGSGSAAIRNRVAQALPLLSDPGIPFPKGWIKSHHLQHLAKDS